MDWIKLSLGLVQLLVFVISYLKDRKLIDDVGAQILADAMRGQADGIAKARKATADVLDAAHSDPASVLRDNDGFRRD